MNIKYAIPVIGIILFHTRPTNSEMKQILPIDDDGGLNDFLLAWGSTAVAIILSIIIC